MLIVLIWFDSKFMGNSRLTHKLIYSAQFIQYSLYQLPTDYICTDINKLGGEKHIYVNSFSEYLKTKCLPMTNQLAYDVACFFFQMYIHFCLSTHNAMFK